MGAAQGLAAQMQQRIQSSGGRQASIYQETHEIPPGERLNYGFVDAGRGTPIGPDGELLKSTNREVISYAGPEKDPELHRLIEWTKLVDRPDASLVDRARMVGAVVARALPENDDRRNWSLIREMSGGQPEGHRVELGDLLRSKTGVCRHRSLLFKVLADHIGLPVSLMRGNFQGYGARGGHAWNEVSDEHGNLFIVDVMHGTMDRADGTLGKSYFTCGWEPRYVGSDIGLRFDLGSLRRHHIEKNGRSGIEINIEHLDASQRSQLVAYMRQNGARGNVVRSSVQNDEQVLRFFGDENIRSVERGVANALEQGHSARIQTTPYRAA